MLSVGSLFAGIGGFDLGLERTGGFRTAWFCEQDDYCQRVLAKHWSGVPCYPDITELRGADVEPVDVLCGGFPCQDLSYAGAGAGLDGARSGLWSEYARLIGELRPRYVIVENVSALLARGLGVVLADLAALGFDAEWDCIPASAVGAPHQRDRIWLVAYPGVGDADRAPADSHASEGASRPPARQRGRGAAVACPNTDGWRLDGLAQPDSGQGRVEGRRGQGEPGHDADGLRLAVADAEVEPVGAGLRADESGGLGWGRPGNGGGSGDTWAVEPDVGRVADGVPARVDRLRALGNSLVPQIPEWIGRRILNWEGGIAP